jgi:hypothetical protein
VGAELWINKEAVRSVTGWSDRTIRWKAQLGALSSRNVSSQEKRGCGPREYALSSLPVEAQLKFLKQPLLSGPACTALALRSAPNQSNLFASLPEIAEPERLSFSARQNGQALKRLEAIAPLVEFSSRSRRSRPTFRTISGVAVRSMNSLVGYLAAQHHVSPRTLWNWYGQYRKLGYAGWSTEFARIRENRGFSKPNPLSAHIWRTSTWVSGCRFGWSTRPCCAICGILSQSAPGHRATAPFVLICNSCPGPC